MQQKLEEVGKVGSPFKIVNLIAKRVIELSEGAPKFVDMPLNTKLTTLALTEVAAKKIGYKIGKKIE